MSEDTKVRSESPELAAMTLPQLKKVATQLGIDGAAKMAKGSLVGCDCRFTGKESRSS